MRKYRRMTFTDRLIIEKLYNSRHSYRAIARITGFSAAAIHREVKRGLYMHTDTTLVEYPRYSATIANDDAVWQASAKGQMIKLGNNHAYADLVATRIKNGESPDAIVGSLKISGEWTVSTPTLYRYIDQGYIPGITNKNLFQKSKKKKRTYRRTSASRPPAGISIERRPDYINTRATPGHWEMDTVIGKSKGQEQAVLVLTERCTRYEIIVKLWSKTANAVTYALHNLAFDYPLGTFQTITVDNGCEFSDCTTMKNYTQEVYYCHPYSSFERGSNENANRIIRRFFLKGESLKDKTQKDCDAVAYYMNNMHRKILGYRTPAELFNEWQATLV